MALTGCPKMHFLFLESLLFRIDTYDNFHLTQYGNLYDGTNYGKCIGRYNSK